MAKINTIKRKINEKGENWIVAETPESIQRMLKSVIKDMIWGNFNYEEISPYFFDNKFLDNLIIAARNELEDNNFYMTVISYYMSVFPATPKIGNYMMKSQSLGYIYAVILNKLEAVKSTGNIALLSDIPAILGQYRNFLN